MLNFSSYVFDLNALITLKITIPGHLELTYVIDLHTVNVHIINRSDSPKNGTKAYSFRKSFVVCMMECMMETIMFYGSCIFHLILTPLMVSLFESGTLTSESKDWDSQGSNLRLLQVTRDSKNQSSFIPGFRIFFIVFYFLSVVSFLLFIEMFHVTRRKFFFHWDLFEPLKVNYWGLIIFTIKWYCMPHELAILQFFDFWFLK